LLNHQTVTMQLLQEHKLEFRIKFCRHEAIEYDLKMQSVKEDEGSPQYDTTRHSIIDKYHSVINMQLVFGGQSGRPTGQCACHPLCTAAKMFLLIESSLLMHQAVRILGVPQFVPTVPRQEEKRENNS
jgi:hypothetical protein